MAKNKIEVGQCYDFRDRVFMVMEGPIFYNKVPFWRMQNTVTKEEFEWEERGILTLRKPFTNCG